LPSSLEVIARNFSSRVARAGSSRETATPALTTLMWRYGAQLSWRLVMIGLTEDASQYVARGYTPTKSTQGYARFRRYGMPISTDPRPRASATGARLSGGRRLR